MSPEAEINRFAILNPQMQYSTFIADAKINDMHN